jgi:hypothetical protein
MASRRSSVFDGVDPGLARAIEAVASGYTKYKVNPRSGVAARPKNPNSLHPRGGAIDVFLQDPKTGRELAGIGQSNPADIAAYQEYANAVYQWALQNDPELAKELGWGGYFAGGGWPQDYMHFQRGGNTPQGGSWEGGFNPEIMAKLGLQSGGGVGGAGGAQQGPTAGTAVQQFTPEQRRNAIASIESAGSGDYGALGVWTGDPETGRDRAYGRYQIMGKNVGPWTKQVLGRAMTPQEFLVDTKAQDAVFDKIFGGYVAKHGEGGAAQAWLGGEGSIGKTDRQDALGTTIGSYANKYLTALGAPAGDATNPGAETYQPGGSLAAPDPTVTSGVDATKDKSSFGDTLGDMFSGMGSIAGGGKDGMPKIQPLKQLQAPGNVTTEGGPLASNAMSAQLNEQARRALSQLMNQAPPPQAPSGNPWRLF